MSRLWLNNDFGPVEAVNESIIIYHVVLSGDTCKMCWSPDLKSLMLKMKKDHIIAKILFDPCRLRAVDQLKAFTGHEGDKF